MRGEIGAITASTLTVAGTLDVSTPPDQLRAIADAIPGARMVEIEAAHLSNVEKPDDFTRALVGFLSGSG